MTATKRPAFQFYPGDWRRDLGVRMLSIAARGLWVELMALMHEGTPYGHLSDHDGQALDDEACAQLVGVPVKPYRQLLEEIERRKVSSRTEAGVLYSRRMVRDEEIRNKRAQGGPSSQEHPNVPKKKGHHEGYPYDGPPKRSKDREKDQKRPPLPPSPSSAVAVASALNPLNSPDGELPPPHPEPPGWKPQAQRAAEFNAALDVAVAGVPDERTRAAVRRLLDEQRIRQTAWQSWVYRVIGWTKGDGTTGMKKLSWQSIAIGTEELLDANANGRAITPLILRIFCEKAATPRAVPEGEETDSLNSHIIAFAREGNVEYQQHCRENGIAWEAA